METTLTTTALRRVKEFTKAYDKRDPDPEKNYGIHGAKLRMVLVGPLGAVQFVLFTQRMLKSVQQELADKYVDDIDDKITIMQWVDDFTSGNEIEEIITFGKYMRHRHGDHYALFRPQPADLGYHSPIPRWEGQKCIGSSRRTGEYEHVDFGDGVLHKSSIWEDVPEAEWPKCEYLEGDKPCYYDDSGLNAEAVYKILLDEGEEAVWIYLENYYNEVFNEED